MSLASPATGLGVVLSSVVALEAQSLFGSQPQKTWDSLDPKPLTLNPLARQRLQHRDNLFPDGGCVPQVVLAGLRSLLATSLPVRGSTVIQGP